MRGDANDIVGWNNGTVTGATLTTDRFGFANGAYSFNGTSNYVTLPNTTILSPSSFTAHIWVKTTQTTNCVPLWKSATAV